MSTVTLQPHGDAFERRPSEAATQHRGDLPRSGHVKWTWSCRLLDARSAFHLRTDEAAPEAGDAVAVRVKSIGNHSAMMTASQARLRLYEDDLLVAVLGNRYATDAFEGEVQNVEELHVLTGAGLVGTVRSRHRGIKPPTEVAFVGYLTEPNGRRVNLKRRLFVPRRPETSIPNVVLVVGTGMNSGKTTTVSKLVHGLVRRGMRVAAAKLTGSVSHRDLHELKATGALDVRDFSDYGFPSTYLCSEDELVSLFHTMLADASRAQPEVLVVEIADGILQRETTILLDSSEMRQAVSSVVLCAACSTSALRAVQEIEAKGHHLACVSGRITSSPLFVRELVGRASIPVVSSAAGGSSIADRLVADLASL